MSNFAVDKRWIATAYSFFAVFKPFSRMPITFRTLPILKMRIRFRVVIVDIYRPCRGHFRFMSAAAPHFLQLGFSMQRNLAEIMAATIASVFIENNVHLFPAYRARDVPPPDNAAFLHMPNNVRNFASTAFKADGPARPILPVTMRISNEAILSHRANEGTMSPLSALAVIAICHRRSPVDRDVMKSVTT